MIELGLERDDPFVHDIHSLGQVDDHRFESAEAPFELKGFRDFVRRRGRAANA